MARKADREREALRRARLRTRERDAAEVRSTPEAARAAVLTDPSSPEVVRRRLAATTCAWCGGAIETKTRGRIPKWCSAACRQSAWVQRQATGSGRAKVDVVERRIENPVRSSVPPPLPRHGEWAGMLDELTRQLDRGAIYARDLDVVLPAVERLVGSVRRKLDLRG